MTQRVIPVEAVKRPPRRGIVDSTEALMSTSRPILFYSLAFVIAGCAQGGGAQFDAGPNRTDAGTTPMDSGGMMGVDAGGMMDTDAGGMMDTDAGDMTGTDAGDMTGTDAGPGTDAGSDAGPGAECSTAAECDDGLACNGAERCVGGSCTSGTPFACDDGVPCTRDRCVEGSPPTCDFTPDDTLCAAGETCGTGGCMATCTDTPCRLVSPQCGCPGGQACNLSGGMRACTTAGATPVGSTCSGAFSCVPGSICINVSQDTTAPASMCNRFCDTDSDCAGGVCIYTLDDGAGGAIPDVTVCSTPCDPIDGSGCTADTRCSIFRETMGSMRFFTDCSAPIGTGGQGAACADSTDCRRGFGCAGSPGECLQWCDGVGFSGILGGCPTGLTCYGFTPAIAIAGTTYGVCDL